MLEEEAAMQDKTLEFDEKPCFRAQQ